MKDEPERETMMNMKKSPGSQAGRPAKTGEPRLEVQAGFTFAELMIALVVVTLVIGGYVGANIKAQQSAAAMNERTLTIQEANQIIETMRNVSRTGAFPGNVVAAYPDSSTPAGSANLTNETITVSYANTTADPLDVTVTVTWLSYTQREQTEVIRTYMTQR